MLISAFFPKLMEKLKHGSMLLRTEESVRFPGLGERTKRWGNYYLESQLMSTDSGDERKVPALEPGPQHLFHFSRKAHPAFRSGEQRCLESRLVEWCQQDRGPPLSTGFTFFSLLITGSYPVYKDRGEGKRKDYFCFPQKVVLMLCGYIINNFSVYIYSSAEEEWRPSAQPPPGIIRMLKNLQNLLTFSIILEETPPGQELPN